MVADNETKESIVKKIAVIGSILFISSIAAAPVIAGGLNVTLTHERSSHGATGTRVTVTLAHQGNGATYIYKYATPLVLLGDAHLATKMFKVVDLSDHSEVAYTGGWMHPTRLDEKYFFALRDSQSISAGYDLRNDYKILPGHHYEVTYRQDLSGVPTNERGDAISNVIRPSMQEEVQSNALDIYVPDDRSQEQTMTAPASASTASDVPFTADQLTQLQTAQATAAQIASQTITYQEGLYTTTENPDGSSTTVFNGSTRYVWWFNNYDSTNPPSSNDTLVDQTVLAIFARLNYSGTSIQFHNGCVAGTDPTQRRMPRQRLFIS